MLLNSTRNDSHILILLCIEKKMALNTKKRFQEIIIIIITIEQIESVAKDAYI
jgi:hypothetical protein